MTADANVAGLEVFDHRIEASVFGDDVKVSSGIGGGGFTEVKGESEIESVVAGRT